MLYWCLEATVQWRNNPQITKTLNIFAKDILPWKFSWASKRCEEKGNKKPQLMATKEQKTYFPWAAQLIGSQTASDNRQRAQEEQAGSQHQQAPFWVFVQKENRPKASLREAGLWLPGPRQWDRTCSCKAQFVISWYLHRIASIGN